MESKHCNMLSISNGYFKKGLPFIMKVTPCYVVITYAESEGDVTYSTVCN